MLNTLPLFGSAMILVIMVAAGYTFSVASLAGALRRSRLLQASRLGTMGVVGLIGVAVLALAYAFVSHDFRLRYVAHYSDRSMSIGYLLTSLWGGQDGSLLWWLFLLGGYTAFAVRGLGKKHLQLQPYVIATLMAVVLFFCILMTFAANPFSVSISGARPDGEGLNPLLQNFYMIIHPPSLYTGFVGCTIPFAFGIAALVTGRLDTEWIRASRGPTMFAWMFLAIGNALGMLWAYEELGWGGYWAWDPVENAAFMPFLTATAFIHSVMIQERRGMFKVWNIFLCCFTFFMTIFGTFLTRSGSIASVHSFAQSSIGIYFVWFLALVVVVSVSLILYRWPELRDLPPHPKLRWAALATGWTMIAITAPGVWLITDRALLGPTGRVLAFSLACGAAAYAGVELVYRRMTRDLKLVSRRPHFESIFSREFTFMLNNWGLLGFMLFVLVATTFPMISEALWNEKVTVGPPYYNVWVQPIALLIFALMGVGTLFGWKTTSPEALKKVARFPGAIFVATIALHLLIGRRIGYPAVVWSAPVYDGLLGKALQAFNAFTPLLGISLVTFNLAVVLQEFYLLFGARNRSGASKDVPTVLWYAGLVPGFVYTLVTLPFASRRRYGGYVVHFGIAIAMLGFTGKSWTVDRETTLSPNQTYQVEDYTLKYIGKRMEVDNSKRMVFADVEVSQGGKVRGVLNPAKFIYKKMPESPTTEVSMLHSLRDDLYLVVGTVNPQTGVASFQIHVNPLVPWIWIGVMILIFGSFVCMWPEFEPEESRAWRTVRGLSGATASIVLGIVLAILPTSAAWGQTGSSSLHSGTVKIEDVREKDIFSHLRCMCGDCQRDFLSSCACGWAQDAREQVRGKLRAGETKDQILLEYAAEHGSDAIAMPPNKGGFRAIYALPLFVLVGTGAGVVFLARRWTKAKDERPAEPSPGVKPEKDDYDDRLDRELRDLDG